MLQADSTFSSMDFQGWLAGWLVLVWNFEKSETCLSTSLALPSLRSSDALWRIFSRENLKQNNLQNKTTSSPSSSAPCIVVITTDNHGHSGHHHQIAKLRAASSRSLCCCCCSSNWHFSFHFHYVPHPRKHKHKWQPKQLRRQPTQAASSTPSPSSSSSTSSSLRPTWEQPHQQPALEVSAVVLPQLPRAGVAVGGVPALTPENIKCVVDSNHHYNNS